MWTFHDFIYSFHIPLFFFISGIFYKDSSNIGQYILKKTKELYLPFIIFSFLLIGIESLGKISECQLSFHTISNIALGAFVSHSIASPLWFLSVLFRCSVIYSICSRLFGRFRFTKHIICCASLICAFYLTGKWMISQSFLALFFYSLGNIILSNRADKLLSISKPALFISIALSTYVILVVSRINPVNFAYGQYGNMLLFLIGALCGIILILSVSILFDGKVSVLSMIGNNTKSVLCFHMLIIRVTLKAFTMLSGTFGITHPIAMISMPTAFVLSIAIPCIVSRIIHSRNNSLIAN